MVTSNQMERQRRNPTLSKEVGSPGKQPDAPILSKSVPSPTSNKRRPSLVIDTKDDRESERNYGDSSRTAVLAQSISPTSAAFSKLITNMRSSSPGSTNKQRLQTYQASPKNLSAIQGVTSPRSQASPRNLSAIQVTSPRSQASPRNLSAIQGVASPRSQASPKNLSAIHGVASPKSQASPRKLSAFQVTSPRSQASPTNLSAIQGVTSPRSQASPKNMSAVQGVASPKSKSNLVIDTAGSFPNDENSPRISPSLFQQSANKVSLLHRSFSSEASECDDKHGEQRQRQSRSPVAAFSKLQIDPLSGRDDEDAKTASQVSNFIDTLHQQKGITPRDTGNIARLPPKSPSVARLASNHKYSSILKNARNVIASSPVARANAAAASFKVSPQSNNALARRKSFLQKAARGYKDSDSDSYDSSDDDSSYSSDSSFSSNEVSTTKKDVGEFIDTLNRRNGPKVGKDMELLSLKTKLNTRRHEKEIAVRKAVQAKAKCDPPATDEEKNPGAEEKKNEFAKVATFQDHASKHDIKNDALTTKLNTRRHEKETAVRKIAQEKAKCDPPAADEKKNSGADEKKNAQVVTSQDHASKHNIKNGVLKTKLNTRRHEMETLGRKVAEEKAKCDPPSAEKPRCDPPGVDEKENASADKKKKNEFTKVATPQDDATKHIIKKDVLKSKSEPTGRKVAQEKAKSDPPAADEKKNPDAGEKNIEFAKVSSPQDYASKHNVEKDVHYYAILSQIQKAVQSGNPALLMGKIFADAGKRGMKLAIVTELFKEEKRKARVFEPVKGVTGTQVETKIRKKTMTKACVIAKEQLAAMTIKVDHPAMKGMTVQKKQSTSDNTTSSKKSNVSVPPAKEQRVSASNSVEEIAATSTEQLAAMTTKVDSPTKEAMTVQTKQSTSDNATSSKKPIVSVSPAKDQRVSASNSVEEIAATSKEQLPATVIKVDHPTKEAMTVQTKQSTSDNAITSSKKPIVSISPAKEQRVSTSNSVEEIAATSKEQLPAKTIKVDHPAKKVMAVQKKQSTSDNATSSKEPIVSVSPAKDQRVSTSNSVEEIAATSKEQLPAKTIKVDHPAKKVMAVRKKQSTSDTATSSKKPIVSVSPAKDQRVSASNLVEDIAATSNPKLSSNAPLVGGKASESKSNVLSMETVTPPAQDMVNSESLASVSSESKGAHHDAALMSEVEARVKEVVRSATPSIEFGKILADAKKRGLPATHLIRLYKQEREELTNAAVKAASLVVKPECDNEVGSSKPEAKESLVPCPPNSAAGFSMEEQLTKDIQNAVRSSNPSEMLGNILADAQSKGLPTEWLFDLYTKERMQVQMEMQMATVAEQGTQPSASDICSTESEVSDVVSELQMEAFSSVTTSASVEQEAHHTADVVDFFSKFSLQSESREANVDSSCEKQVLAPSVSEVSQYEIVELNREEISSESDVSEVPVASREVGRLSLEEEEEVSVSTSSRDNNKVRFETAHADEDNLPVIQRLWKSPLQKKRLSRKKLKRGGKRRPINGVAAAAALTQKRRLRGPRRTHLTQSTQERTKEHSGFLDIDFYSLYESTTCHAENEEIDKAPWEYRDVRQRFLAEKSVDCRNWFGSFESKRGNDRVSNPVVCPKSLQIPVTVIPESGDWNEDWYTTWKSRRDNPNNLVTFTEADIPSLSLDSSAVTSNTSTTITESHSSDQSMLSSDSTYSEKKPVLIEIGNLVSVRFSGERVSKVHPDYTSSLRRSRWRKKYMRGEFAFDAEM